MIRYGDVGVPSECTERVFENDSLIIPLALPFRLQTIVTRRPAFVTLYSASSTSFARVSSLAASTPTL